MVIAAENRPGHGSAENCRVARAAGIVGAATLISRVCGFGRDMVIAWFFGTGLSSDAFFAAFTIPNILRRLFSEGTLGMALVPELAGHLAQHGRLKMFRLASALLWLVSLLLTLMCVAGIVLAPWLVRITAPGFIAAGAKFVLTVELTRIMLPYVLLVGLVAVCMAILNVLGHFTAPAVAPILLNLAIIGGALFISPRLTDPVKGLAYGVLIGGCLQLLLQLPVMIRQGVRFWRPVSLFHPGLRRIGAVLVPAVFGAAVYQVNILVGRLLASLLVEGSVSYLYYADRLVQFPLGIFAFAVTTAVLPSLSKQAAHNDQEGLQTTCSLALRLVFFITVPAMVGLIILREPIIRVLFQRGAFDEQSVQLTARALLYYAMGLWAFATVRVMVSAFFALKDTRTPVVTALWAVAANAVLGVCLMPVLAHGGLALATTLASVLNLGLLGGAFKRRLGGLDWHAISTSAAKTVVCAAVMGLVIWYSAHRSLTTKMMTDGQLALSLGANIALGVGIYLGTAFWLRSPELAAAWEAVKRSLLKR